MNTGLLLKLYIIVSFAAVFGAVMQRYFSCNLYLLQIYKPISYHFFSHCSLDNSTFIGKKKAG